MTSCWHKIPTNVAGLRRHKSMETINSLHQHPLMFSMINEVSWATGPYSTRYSGNVISCNHALGDHFESPQSSLHRVIVA